MKLYEENNRLHAENARLRKQLDSYKSGEEYSKIEKQYISTIEKQNKTISRLEHELEKQNGRYAERGSKIRNLEMLLFTARTEIAELHEKIQDKDKEIISLTKELSEEKELNHKLTAQIKRDFTNSSIPSSLVPNHKKICNSRTKTGKKPGGQPGHKGHCRKQYEPTKIIELPAPAEVEGNKEYYRTGKTVKRQIVDLSFSVNVTEYRADEYRSRITGKTLHAEFPKGLYNEVCYGPGINATAYLLNNYCNTSIDKVQEFIKVISGGQLEISKGYIASLWKKVSKNAEDICKEIAQDLLLSPYINVDGTNVRINGKQAYVYVTANEKYTLFHYRDSKGLKAIQGTPLTDYQHTLVHDHDVSYYHFGRDHQECLAHVLRYLQDSIENEPHLKWNTMMKSYLQKLISDTKAGSQLNYETVMIDYLAILDLALKEYSDHPPSKYYRDGFCLATRMKEYADAHMLFVQDPSVPYTNNLAERECRKIKRKCKQVISFRSSQSVIDYCAFLSLIETKKNCGISPFDALLSIFSPCEQ